MKAAGATLLLIVAFSIEATAISVAIVGGISGMIALIYALHRTSTLRHSIEHQATELRRVKARVAALEPPRFVG